MKEDKVKNVPEKIYLQVGEESEGDFNTLVPGSVSWASSRQNESDIEYCLTPLAVDNSGEKKYVCPLCGGDGKETCSNPDHGFITGMGGEIGRLGCPVCGHDENHKVPNGGKCEVCEGTGIVNEDQAEVFCKEYHYNDELIEIEHASQPTKESAEEAAETIYRKMFSYANPSEVRGVTKDWIIEKIKEGLQQYASQSNSEVGEYQLCPKCNGQGIVEKPPYIAAEVQHWSSTTGAFPCDVCLGEKIIKKPILSNSEVWTDEKIKRLLKWQINECALFVGRCAIGKRQSSHEINECIKSTPLIDFQPSPPKQL